MSLFNAKSFCQKIENWFQSEQRELPWRQNRNPYPIWISEVMLQQTTVKAVIPYFQKFMSAFPELDRLAKASEAQVLQHWSGLGYYSRARNLLRASKQISKLGGFPKTFADLIEFPGFGPYTARAVSSQAFGERVGVIDGNVTRVLCRILGWKKEWWTPAVRSYLQETIDSWILEADEPGQFNQAMMELGATICTPTKPTCSLCPVRSNCLAFKEQLTQEIPVAKPRPTKELWLWSPVVLRKQKMVGLIENSSAPFLKKQKIFPGNFSICQTRPKEYDFKHTITRYEIYVRIEDSQKMEKQISHLSTPIEWVNESDLAKVTPTRILAKVLTLRPKKSATRPSGKVNHEN